MSKAAEIKLGVVQVQQRMTDSATQAASGFDDGFNEAEKHAQDVKRLFEELKTMNIEYKEDLDIMQVDTYRLDT